MNWLLVYIFWSACAKVIYSYVLYPFFLHFLTNQKKPNTFIFDDEKVYPTVIIWMAVFNEEKVIKQKLESIFKTIYPLAKLQVWIGSDASTDATNSLVSSFQKQHSNIRFFDFKERSGKAGVLNKMYTQFQQDFSEAEQASILFIPTDANVFFDENTIYQLVKHFANPKIGQVGANIQNTGIQNAGISEHESNYIQRENDIKYKEGLLGVMQGAFGGCYAIRASLWQPIPANFLMEDFFISMGVLTQDRQAIFEPLAVCLEDVSDDVAEEFRRKTRISTGNFQNLFYYMPYLFRLNYNSFCFWSHKGIRWFTPLLLLLALVSSVLLRQQAFYLICFIAQLVLLSSVLFDKLFKRIGVHVKLVRLIAYFYSMNLALVKGWYIYQKGVKTNVWTPTKRNI